MLSRRPHALKLAVALLAAWPAGSALGQNDQRQNRQDEPRQQSWQRDRDQQSQRSRSQRDPQQGQSGRQQAQRDQEGLLIIGYDLNSDGKTDLYYMIDDVQFNRLHQEMSRQKQAQRPADQQGEFDSRQEQQQQATLSGTVRDTRRVNLDNQRDAHNLMKIQLQNGRSAIVNLGPNKTLRDLNLQQGDSIRVTGRKGTINGRSVLMAQSIQADGRTFTISTQGQQQRSMQQQASFSGRVEDTTRISLQGEQREHNLVRVTTQDGQSQIVNLGPDKELSDLDVRKGDTIRVQGKRGQIDGRSVIFAQSVEVDGQTTRISWQQRQQSDRGVYATPRDQQDERSQQQYDRRQRDQVRDYTFRGTLQAFYRTTVPYATGEHNFVKMWLEDGESMIIDLGSQTTLQELGLVGLADDERIVIRGTPTQIAGRTVLKAQSITIDGRTTQLLQSQQRQSQQQSGQSRQQKKNQSDVPWWLQD